MLCVVFVGGNNRYFKGLCVNLSRKLRILWQITRKWLRKDDWLLHFVYVLGNKSFIECIKCTKEL